MLAWLQVAANVNAGQAHQEKMKKMLDLSASGASGLVRPGRKVVLDQVLVNDVTKKKMHIWLFNDIVVHLSEAKAKQKSNLADPKNQWPLHLVWVLDGKAEDDAKAMKSKSPMFSFVLIGPTRAYQLSVKSIEERNQWVTQIRYALDNATDARTHACHCSHVLGTDRCVCSECLREHFRHLSVTTDSNMQQEKAANMTLESERRWGQFEFPSGAVYAGWWRFNPDLVQASIDSSGTPLPTGGESQACDDPYGGDLVPAVRFDGKGYYSYFSTSDR